MRRDEDHTGGSLQLALNHQTQILQFIWCTTYIVFPAWTKVALYFRMECKACRPQRPSTPLKSAVHLAGNHWIKINKTHYFSTRQDKHEGIPNMKLLACGVAAVYGKVSVQTQQQHVGEYYLNK